MFFYRDKLVLMSNFEASPGKRVEELKNEEEIIKKQENPFITEHNEISSIFIYLN